MYALRFSLPLSGKAPSEIFFLLFPAFPPTFPYFIGGVTRMQLNRFATRSSSFYPSKKKIILPPCIACNVVKNRNLGDGSWLWQSEFYWLALGCCGGNHQNKLLSYFPSFLFLTYDFKFHSHCHHSFFAHHSFLTTTGKISFLAGISIALIWITRLRFKYLH